MKKYAILIILSVVFLGCYAFWQYETFNDGKLHVVICDVGQGDGIFIRTPNGVNIINDGGPNDSILDCLSRNTPFWDRTITLMILTHPHADHYTGLISVLKEYKVGHIITEKLNNKTLGFIVFSQNVEQKQIPIQYVFAKDSVKLEGLTLKIVGPTAQFLAATSPNGIIGESKEFGSVETLLRFGKFSMLLTGDSQADEIRDALQTVGFSNLDVLQVPHHGSLTGLSDDVLSQLNPKIGIISVGLHNPYGHPSPYTLNLLQKFGVKTFRTDQNGDVEIITDGKTYSVKVEKR